jgi:hypothetical protein
MTVCGVIKAVNDQLIASPVSMWFGDCRFLSSAVVGAADDQLAVGTLSWPRDGKIPPFCLSRATSSTVRASILVCCAAKP